MLVMIKFIRIKFNSYILIILLKSDNILLLSDSFLDWDVLF